VNAFRAPEILARRTESAIQDEFVTVRNDRYVIPVKSDFFAGRFVRRRAWIKVFWANYFIEPP